MSADSTRCFPHSSPHRMLFAAIMTASSPPNPPRTAYPLYPHSRASKSPLPLHIASSHPPLPHPHESGGSADPVIKLNKLDQHLPWCRRAHQPWGAQARTPSLPGKPGPQQPIRPWVPSHCKYTRAHKIISAIRVKIEGRMYMLDCATPDPRIDSSMDRNHGREELGPGSRTTTSNLKFKYWIGA